MPEPRPTPSNPRRAVGFAGGAVLGLVLLVAAWGKALDPLAFAEEIRVQGLELALSAETLAILFVAFEVALGAALLLGLRRGWVLAPASAMVALFLFLNGRAYWRFSRGLIDAGDSCGCFGSLISRTPAEAFWQDLLLLLPPLLLAFVGRRPAGKPPVARLAALAALTVATGLFTWRAPDLPLDDLATRLKPGVRVDRLCAGEGAAESVRICLDALVPELDRGEHLVVISDLSEPALGEGVERLNELALSETSGVWILTAASEEEQTAFFWRQGPAFEIREVPSALIDPLVRSTPRSFRVRDGAVEATWSGLPPEVAGSGRAALVIE